MKNYIIKIITKKINAGYFNITIMRDYENIGSFETTDMQLIDDIYEMNNNGFEKLLIMHDTFDEVVQTCLNKLK